VVAAGVEKHSTTLDVCQRDKRANVLIADLIVITVGQTVNGGGYQRSVLINVFCWCGVVYGQVGFDRALLCANNHSHCGCRS
jgi:hypothetical protein